MYSFTGSTAPSEVGVLTSLKGPKCTWTLQYQTGAKLWCGREGPTCRCSGHHSAGFASTAVQLPVSIWINVHFFPADFDVGPVLHCKPGMQAQLWALLGTFPPASAAPPAPGSEYPAHGTGRKTSQTGVTLSICTDTSRATKLSVKVWIKVGPGFLPVAKSHLPTARRQHLCFLGFEMTFRGGSSMGQGCPWGNQAGRSFAEML